MKLFSHFAVIGFSNTYLFGPESGGDAILVDPGIMDQELLQFIEDNNFYVRHILITTPDEAHIHGLKTILKIYEADLYSGASQILEFPCNKVSDGEKFSLTGFSISVFNVSGHSKESMVFKVDDMLFTGDAITAGKVGDFPNPYAQAMLITSIREKLAPLDGHLLVFPGHGPPSTLEAEKRYNPAFLEDTQS